MAYECCAGAADNSIVANVDFSRLLLCKGSGKKLNWWTWEDFKLAHWIRFSKYLIRGSLVISDGFRPWFERAKPWCNLPWYAVWPKYRSDLNITCFWRFQKYWSIAVTCTLPVKSGNDNITTFIGPLKVHKCWGYMDFWKRSFIPYIHLVFTLSRLYPKPQYIDVYFQSQNCVTLKNQRPHLLV